MKHIVLSFGVLASLTLTTPLFSHCQMPCGIYHDEMVYDQIDQYVETMAKAITVLNDNKFNTVKEKNTFIRWVTTKESQSNAIAELLTSYFLQQKMKPGEDDTPKKLAAVHQMLFLLVQIKQNVDLKLVEKFSDQWEKFKLMFHVEGYECRVHFDKFLKLQKMQQEQNKKAPKQSNEHDHDIDLNHAH